jgi:hypothetical protein
MLIHLTLLYGRERDRLSFKKILFDGVSEKGEYSGGSGCGNALYQTNL